jgi:hypothetical protein
MLKGPGSAVLLVDINRETDKYPDVNELRVATKEGRKRQFSNGSTRRRVPMGLIFICHGNRNGRIKSRFDGGVIRGSGSNGVASVVYLYLHTRILSG